MNRGKQARQRPRLERLEGDQRDHLAGRKRQVDSVQQLALVGQRVGNGLEADRARDGLEEFGPDRLADGGNLVEIAVNAVGRLRGCGAAARAIPKARPADAACPATIANIKQRGRKPEVRHVGILAAGCSTLLPTR